MVTLGHVIYPPFYEKEGENFNSSHQQLFSIARSKVEDILEYVETKVVFWKDNMEVDFRPLFETYFVQQVRCLLRQCMNGLSNQGRKYTATMIREALAASLAGHKWFGKEVARQNKIGYPCTGYQWISDEVYSISARGLEGVFHFVH